MLVWYDHRHRSSISPWLGRNLVGLGVVICERSSLVVGDIFEIDWLLRFALVYFFLLFVFDRFSFYSGST